VQVLEGEDHAAPADGLDDLHAALLPLAEVGHAGDEAAGFAFLQSIATPSVTGTLVDELAPGPVAIIHYGANLVVDAPSGALASITHEALLAGGNLAAVVSGEDLEVIQFGTAELIGEGRYRLSKLVRGLGGTESAALTITPAGARFVLLDKAPVPLALAAQTLIGGTTLRVEPHGGGVGTFSRTEIALSALPRSLQPLAPVHPRARRLAGGDLAVSWIRRTRGSSDLWELASTPLNEEAERYHLRVERAGVLLREAETQTPAWVYDADAQATDGVLPGETLRLVIAQIGTGGRLGAPRVLDVAL